MHQTPLAVVIVHGIVPSRPIVPKRQRARLPLEPVGVFGLGDMVVENLKERFRFRISPSFDSDGEARVYIERLLAADRVCDDQRVGSILGRRFVIPCLLYTSPSPRDRQKSRMPSSA